MLTKEQLQFIQREKNISMEFVKRAKACGEGAYPLYLYGAGVQKLHVVRFLKKHGIRINAILDSFQEGDYQGIPIIRFADFLRSSPNPQSWFVISAPTAEKEIRETLEQYFPKENIFFFETTPYVEFLPDVERYRVYLLEHWDELSLFHDALADEKSKKTLVSIIKGRISGKTDYFREAYSPDKYYPEDVLQFSNQEVFAEVGACRGETLLQFLEHCPEYEAAYCFEPDKNNLRILYEVVNKLQSKGKIKIIPKGAWDHDGEIGFFSDEATSLSRVTEENGANSNLIETVRIDDVVDKPITYLKISAMGAEPRVLRGSAEQIKKNHPKVCVCVSYSGEAILNFWNYLRELVPGYRFYLRHHLKDSGIESFLYAT